MAEEKQPPRQPRFVVSETQQQNSPTFSSNSELFFTGEKPVYRSAGVPSFEREAISRSLHSPPADLVDVRASCLSEGTVFRSVNVSSFAPLPLSADPVTWKSAAVSLPAFPSSQLSLASGTVLSATQDSSSDLDSLRPPSSKPPRVPPPPFSLAATHFSSLTNEFELYKSIAKVLKDHHAHIVLKSQDYKIKFVVCINHTSIKGCAQVYSTDRAGTSEVEFQKLKGDSMVFALFYERVLNDLEQLNCVFISEYTCPVKPLPVTPQIATLSPVPPFGSGVCVVQPGAPCLNSLFGMISSEYEDAICEAIQGIARLSAHDTNHEPLLTQGVVPHLVSAIQSKLVETRRNAASAIANLASCCSKSSSPSASSQARAVDVSSCIAQGNVLRILIQLLSDEDKQVQRECARALACLSEKYRQQIFDEGGSEPLYHLLTSSSDNLARLYAQRSLHNGKSAASSQLGEAHRAPLVY